MALNRAVFVSFFFFFCTSGEQEKNDEYVPSATSAFCPLPRLTLGFAKRPPEGWESQSPFCCRRLWLFLPLSCLRSNVRCRSHLCYEPGRKIVPGFIADYNQRQKYKQGDDQTLSGILFPGLSTHVGRILWLRRLLSAFQGPKL